MAVIVFAVPVRAQIAAADDAPVGRFGLGLFYEVEDGPGLEFDLQARNLFGRDIEADASFSTTQRERHGRIAATSSLAGFPGWDIGFAITGQQTDQRGVAYDHTALGAQLTLGRNISHNMRFQARLGQRHSRISNVGTDQPVLVDEGAAGWVVDRSIGYGFRYVAPPEAYDGLSVFQAGFSQDVSGLGGDRRYLVSRAQVTLRQGFMGGWLRTRAELELGALQMQSGNSRATERFYLGDYMRGFRRYGAGPRDTSATGNDAMGGDYLAVMRFDVEVPLTRSPANRFFGGAFVDVGSAWGLGDDRAAGGGTIDDARHWRAVAGVNVGWNTGMGRVNLTLADAVVRQASDQVMSVNLSFSTRF